MSQRLSTSTGRVGIALAIVLALAAALTLWLTHSDGNASASSDTANIAVLGANSTAPLAAEKLDPSLVKQLNETGSAPGSPFTLDLSTAREALVTDDGIQLVAGRSGNEEVCAMPVVPPTKDGLSQHLYASPSCASIAEFNKTGASTVLGSAPRILVAGLVPDGVDSVTLTLADGSTKTANVTNNGFAITSTVATRTLSFDGPNGHVEIDAPSLED